jgi:hypothetical protein
VPGLGCVSLHELGPGMLRQGVSTSGKNVPLLLMHHPQLLLVLLYRGPTINHGLVSVTNLSRRAPEHVAIAPWLTGRPHTHMYLAASDIEHPSEYGPAQVRQRACLHLLQARLCERSPCHGVWKVQALFLDLSNSKCFVELDSQGFTDTAVLQTNK